MILSDFSALHFWSCSLGWAERAAPFLLGYNGVAHVVSMAAKTIGI